MSACTFFGHRECPNEIQPKLREVLIDLIENHGVQMFYVGNQGQYDTLVRHVLCELKAEYPEIDYAVVLAYMPKGKEEYEDLSDTLLPEEVAAVPPRYAIDRRNKWMLKHADFVVTYITHDWGGAAKFAKMAERLGKKVICLSNMNFVWR